MNQVKLMTLFVLVGMLAIQLPASAEILQGDIVSVDLKNNSLRVTQPASATEPAKELVVLILENTELKGFRVLDDLEAGRGVRIDATEKSDGTYEAKSVEIEAGLL